jgi:hypothetical protein
MKIGNLYRYVGANRLNLGQKEKPSSSTAIQSIYPNDLFMVVKIEQADNKRYDPAKRRSEYYDVKVLVAKTGCIGWILSDDRCAWAQELSNENK